MTPLFKKLNLKSSKTIHVLNAPTSIEAELSALEGIAIARKAVGSVSFGIAFAVTQAELNRVSNALIKRAEDDAILWFAYPKGTSSKYTCEFNRDSGWTVMGTAGYEPVRIVAIDDDWSALRFRHANHIKSLNRVPGGAISKAGRRGNRAGRGP